MRKMGSFVCLSCLLPSYGNENVKTDSSLVFSTDDRKVSVTVWAKYLSASERSYLVLSENAMDCWTLMVTSKSSTLENAVSLFQPSISHKQQPKSTSLFEITQEDLSFTLAKIVIFFTVISRKYKKSAILDSLMTITLEVNMITRQMTQFFSSHIWALFLVIFILSI